MRGRGRIHLFAFFGLFIVALLSLTGCKIPFKKSSDSSTSPQAISSPEPAPTESPTDTTPGGEASVPNGSLSELSLSAASIDADGAAAAAVTVTLRDGNSNPVPGKEIQLTSSRGSTDVILALSGTTNDSGQATFSISSVTAGTALLTAIDVTDSLAIDQQAIITFLATSPSTNHSSIVGTGPVVANGIASSTISITLKDSHGNAVSGITPIFSATNTGSGNTYGPCSATNSGGVSVCTLKSTHAETKTLSITSPVSLSGGTVVFNPFAASQLSFGTQPSSTSTSLQAFAQQPVVRILDSQNNLVTSGADSAAQITLSLSGGTGTLGGTVSMNATGGVADFSGKGLNIDLVGSDKVLSATKAATSASGVLAATSGTFSITHGAAFQIDFSTQPTGCLVNTACATQPVIQIKDQAGNAVTTGSDSTLSVALALSTGSGTLSGTTSMNATAGIADFSGKGLKINRPETGDRLTATSSGMTAQSSAFDVTLGSSFSADWPFSALTSSSYTMSGSSLELSGGVVRLATASQNDNSSSLFGGGTFIGGAVYDGTNSYLRLGTGSSTTEIDSSWVPEAANLVSHWKLNESSGATSVADSIGSNPGTPQSSVTLGTTGRIGNAASFNGAANSWIKIPYSASLGSVSSVTIASWVNFSATSTRMIFNTGDAGSYSYQLYFSSGKAALRSGATTLVGTNNHNNGKWHHIVGVINGTTGTLYVDGAQEATGTVSTIPAISLDSQIGTSCSGSDSTTCGNIFSGKIDEVAVWNTALSASAVNTLYQRGSSKYAGTFVSRIMDAFSSQSWQTLAWTPTLPFGKPLLGSGGNESQSAYTSLFSDTLMTGIVGLWPLDGALGNVSSGSTISDTSGNGRNGTLSTSSGTAVNYITGRFNQALAVNSGTSYVTFGNLVAADFGTSDFTASLWFKTSKAANMHIMNKRNVCGHGSFWATAIGSSGAISFEVDQDSSGTNYIGITTPTNGYNDGKWHHLAVRRSGASAAIFVDGKSQATGTATSVANISNTYDFQLGIVPCAGAGQIFIGSLDDVALWSRALDAREILQLYRRGANRAYYQVRTCSDSTCSGGTQPWRGPDGTDQSYFSELFNTVSNASSGTGQASLPNMTFSNFGSLSLANNRYFQYRTILESDDENTLCDYGSGATACSPEIKSIAVGPAHYDSSAPTVSNAAGVSYRYLTGLTESLGSSGCSGQVKYNLSPDNVTWYYWAGAAWGIGDGSYATANAATELTTEAMSAFATDLGAGSIYFKAFLKSDGTQPCELDSLQITGY